MGTETHLKKNLSVGSWCERSAGKRKVNSGDLWRLKTLWTWRHDRRPVKQGSVWGRAEKLRPGQGRTPGCCPQEELMGNPFPSCAVEKRCLTAQALKSRANSEEFKSNMLLDKLEICSVYTTNMTRRCCDEEDLRYRIQ